MKRRLIWDLVLCILVGLALYLADAPFWFVIGATALISIVLGALNVMMDVLDIIGEGLDAIILILKKEQE